MKITKISPIYKKEDKHKISNYRPIALLPVFSKILEKVVYNQLYSYFIKNMILCENQYGFRKNYSTELAILEFQNRILNCYNSNNNCIGLFLDLFQAFDTLEHSILLTKLEVYGIRGIPLLWFKSYLTERIQYVKFRDQDSDCNNITHGVPQGSVLGPLLFLIYINDLTMVSSDAKFILFADDTNIIFSSKLNENIEKITNENLKNIIDWFNVNKLSINLTKTQYIVFSKSTNNILNQNFKIALNNNELQKVTNVKFLGVHLQSNLQWNIHINEVAKQISKTIGIISRIKHTVPKSVLVMLYKTLIEPYLTYALTVWGDSNAKTINRLNILQKRVIRLITNSKYNAHTEPLFKKLNTLKLNDLFKYNCCKLYYKKLHSLLPAYHANLLQTNQEVQPNRLTRQSQYINIKAISANYEKQSLNYKIGTIWNNLPEVIKISADCTYAKFSDTVKNHFLSQYSNTCLLQHCYICST